MGTFHQVPQFSQNKRTSNPFTMTMPLYSTLKRSQPYLDLISMDGSESNCSDDSDDPFPEGTLKKRSAANTFGWDHYRSEEDLKATFEVQGWRNQKRSRRQECAPQILSNSRFKIPRYRSFSSVRENESRPLKMNFRSVPSTVYCAPKPSCGEFQSIYGRSPSAIDEDISDAEILCKVTQDFAMLKSSQEEMD